MPSANWKTNKHTQFNFLSKTNITNYFSGPNFYCLEVQGITSWIWANKDKVSFSWQSCFYRKLIQSEFLQQSHLTIPELHKTASPHLHQLVVSWTLQAIWCSGRQSLQLEFGRRTNVCHLPFCAILYFFFFFFYVSDFLFFFFFTCLPHPNPPSHLPLHPLPPGPPRAPGPSACLMHPTWAGDLFHPW